jgi:hypothetical protein
VDPWSKRILDFLIPFSINTKIELGPRKIARDLKKCEKLLGDSLEQLSLLTLCPDLNGI